jgi:peptidoglycan/LPS O-acetylase OafA/YrhL
VTEVEVPPIERVGEALSLREEPAAPVASPGYAVRSNGYRPDIDGLRAIAVLSVVFYHFALWPFSGGFVGVDVFFVISGFLITSILLTEMSEDRFSIIAFYERRVRRILPALLVVVLVLFGVGMVVLLPRALAELGKSTEAVLAFVSNIYFWRSTSGYFDGPAETRPLLHTWTLAVEEQFYILFPMFLALVIRFGRRWALAGTLAMAAASLALSAWLTFQAPTASFYLTPVRAWELLIGAVLAFAAQTPTAPPRWLAELAGAAGILLIAFAVICYGPSTPIPGVASLAPCLGAVLLIYAGSGPHTPVSSRLLAMPALVAVGLISYSLYLWHWPIFVLLRHHLVLAPLDGWTSALAIAASFAAAALSWRLIEQPIRRKQLLRSRAAVFGASAVVALGLFAVAFVTAGRAGLPERFPDLPRVAMQDEPPRPDWAPYRSDHCFVERPGQWGGPTCMLAPGRQSGRHALLWGDSYAGHYASGFLALRDEVGPSVLEYTSPRCPPVIGYDAASNRGCRQFNRQALSIINSFNIDTVILSAKWESYLAGHKLALAEVGRTVAALRRRGLQVVLVGQSPIYYFPYPDEYQFAAMRRGGRADEGWAAITFDRGLNQELMSAAPGAVFFDPSAVLCRAQQCRYREKGLYLVGDNGHLTRYGSEQVVRRLLDAARLR